MFGNYLKIAVKVLLRRKFFTFVSLFGIAFTLMVLIVIAALMQHANSNGKPEIHSDRCLHITKMSLVHSEKGNEARSSPGYKFLDRHIRNLEGVENYTIYSQFSTVVAYVDNRKLELSLKRTDGRFWEIMDFEFIEGRPLTREDEATGRHAAVINKATRDRYFNGESAVGKSLEADGQTYEVVGVVENVAIYRMAPYSDVWVPISSAKSSNYRHQLLSGFNATLLARKKSDFPIIKKSLASELDKLELDDPEAYNRAFAFADTKLEMVARSLTMSRKESAGLEKFAGIMILLMLLFMLLPCVNLINLNMSRIMERYSEIGVRKAFGATSGELAAQFLVENLTLTILGSLFGLLFAHVILRMATVSGIIPYADLNVNPSVFFQAMALAGLFGILSGVYPAWRMSRQHPVTALKGGAQ